MSSDFESLSCDDEDTHLRHGNRAAHSSGSFDSLDDLVAEQDAQLLRCLPMVQDSHNLRRGLIDDSEDDSPAAAYGHRAYGVTGHHRAPAQPASHSLLHHLGVSRAASHQPQQQQPSSVDHFNKKPQSGRASKNNSAGGGGVDQGDPSRGKSSVHLFTPQPKESPDLPPPLLSSRATSPETRTTHSAMPCTVSRPPFSAPLSAEDEGPPFHNDGVDDLARQAHTRYRTAADVNDGDDAAWQATGASATSPLLQQPQQRSQQESSQTWRVTCPPDSGQITPATSAATLTASATTRRSAAGYHDNDNGNEEEEERQHPRSSTDTRDRGSSAETEELATLIDQEHPSAPANSAAAAAEVVDASVPVATVGSGAAPPVRAGHDADGFYRTGLLEDSTEDEDDDTTAGGTTTNSQRQAVAALAEGGNGDVVPPSRTRDAAAVLQQGTVHAAMQSPALTSLTTQPPPSTTTAAESLSASSTLRGKLAMATEELHRVAAAMPRMTNVHVLSLIITVLVPINVLCLDVMAFAWIRRQVDTRYRFSVGLARSSGSSNTTTTCMGSSFLLRGKDLLSLSTFDSGKQGSLVRCLDGEGSNSMQQHLSDSHHNSNCSSSSSSSKTPINISSNSNTHAIPTLCSIFLWLMFPNGLLARLLLLQRTSWKAGSAAGASLMQTAPSADGLPEQTEVVWASHLYERLRQSAPQLAVLELYVHYAYLWAMVHAAVLLDHWMPTKAGSEPFLPLPGMGKAHG